MKVIKSIFALSIATATLFLYTNCSKSTLSTQANSDTGTNTGTCTAAQLATLESDIVQTLSTVVTDVDFSFDVVTEDGREIHYDRGASTMTSVYQSASTSKWPAATMILSFMESSVNQNSAHRLTLDSHPQDFLDATIWPIPPTDGLYNMTLRQLLSFTSGMTHETQCVNQAGNGATMNYFDCITEIANGNVGLGLQPGVLYDYNSDHLQVAGAMAIKARDLALGVTDSSWQDIYTEFQNRTGLFQNSTFRAPSPKNPRLSGGMQWTGNDYMGFLRAAYYKQILSNSTMPGETAPYVVQQFDDQRGTTGVGNSPALSTIHEDWHYGFGLWLQCHANPFNCQNTVSAWACPGSLGAFPFLDRGHKFYGIIARQGGLATFNKGYAVYSSVSDMINSWATKDCQ